MNEIATNDFNYSLVDAKTKEFLEERANIIYGIQSKSAYEIEIIALEKNEWLKAL